MNAALVTAFSALLVLGLPAQFQINQTAAELSLNGVSSSGTAAAESVVNVGNSARLSFASTSIGFPFDIFFNGAPQVAAPPGLVLNGQLVNVDVLGAGFALLSGGANGFTVGGAPIGAATYTLNIDVPCTSPGLISVQSFAIDPTISGAVALSSAVTLNCFACVAANPNATPVSLTDDSFSAFALTAPFNFYGITYSQCFVGSNGYVTFETGDTDFSESAAEMLSQEPRIAILWDDLNPATGGTVLFFADVNGFYVRYDAVPEFANQNSNTVQLIASAQLLTIDYCVVDSQDSLVGLSPGRSLSTAPLGALDWSAGPIALMPTEAAFELFAGSRTFDLSGRQLNLVLDATGGPIASL